jgi:pimeloyl-ACP methyl ester carboxylesterase
MQTDTVTTPDGRSLDVYLAGPDDGDVLLFHDGTPGAGIVSARFHALTAARRLRFVSFSRPGYGASTRRPGRTVADVAEDAVAVLDHLGAERCYTMGFSGGGPHALACAARLPERVDAAAIVGSVAPYGVEGLDFLAGMAQENVEEFGAALAGSGDLEVFLTGVLPSLNAVTGGDVADALGGLVPPVDRAALTNAYTEALAADLRRALSNGIWGWHDDDLAFVRPWGFELGEIRVPVSLWQGRQDRMVPYAHGEWLGRHLPEAGARVQLLANHGHLSLAISAIDRVLDELISSATRRVG